MEAFPPNSNHGARELAHLRAEDAAEIAEKRQGAP